ncbi:MAG TPA: cytochrome c [Candidatus Sulfotelmatobacter sp.]|nr:cytochrome c [Candidatus Sulfotelmatobacter sp.]
MNGRTVEQSYGRTLLVVVAVLAVLAVWRAPARGASRGDPKAGKEPYEKFCAVCHGPTGKGDGQGLRGLPVHPKSFSDAAALRNVTDQALFDTIQKGGAATGKSPIMPPFGDQIKEAQIRDLVAYLRSLAAPAR